MDDPTVTADQPVHYNFEHLEDNVLDCMVSQDIVRVVGKLHVSTAHQCPVCT